MIFGEGGTLVYATLRSDDYGFYNGATDVIVYTSAAQSDGGRYRQTRSTAFSKGPTRLIFSALAPEDWSFTRSGDDVSIDLDGDAVGDMVIAVVAYCRDDGLHRLDRFTLNDRHSGTLAL